MNKGFAHILILPIAVAIILVIGYSYYQSNKDSEMSDQTELVNEIQSEESESISEAESTGAQSTPTLKTATKAPIATVIPTQKPTSTNSVQPTSPPATATKTPTSAFVASPTPTVPVSGIGFSFSADSIDTVVNNNGDTNGLFSFTSTGSTKFSFLGDVMYQGGINWSPATGSMYSGQTIQQKVQVFSNVPEGVYEGTMTFTDITTGHTKVFPTKLTVL